MGRATPLKRGPGGRLASAKSKTGDPACSQAMSTWKTSGMTPNVAKVLGRCRAMAQLRRRAEGHRGAGREGIAANLEKRAGGQYVTQKERLARAQELRAKRGEKQAAPTQSPAKPQAESRPSIDHSMLSPSGRVSKRARAAALERQRVALFGKEGLQLSLPKQPTDAQRLLQQSKQLRGLAERGMKPVAYRKQADAALSKAQELMGRNTPDRLTRARELRAQRASRQSSPPAVAQQQQGSIKPTTRSMLDAFRKAKASSADRTTQAAALAGHLRKKQDQAFLAGDGTAHGRASVLAQRFERVARGGSAPAPRVNPREAEREAIRQQAERAFEARQAMRQTSPPATTAVAPATPKPTREKKPAMTAMEKRIAKQQKQDAAINDRVIAERQRNRALLRQSGTQYRNAIEAARNTIRDNRLERGRKLKQIDRADITARVEAARKLRRDRNRLRSTTSGRNRLAEQQARAETRYRAKLALFGGKFPEETWQ